MLKLRYNIYNILQQIMNNRYWLQKSPYILQKYYLNTISSLLKTLPLQIFYTAMSPFSGPIALLVNKNIGHQYILPNGYDSSIIILSVKGQVKKQINYTMKDKLIYFGFTKHEQLLIVDANGNYWVVDPFSGHITQGGYGGSSSVNDNDGEKVARFRGCQLLPKQRLLMLRDKQLVITHSLYSNYQVLSILKPSLDNPLFSSLGQQYYNEIVYLTKHQTIELYNFQTQKKQTIYYDEYLSEHGNNLLNFIYDKKKGILGLIYKQPSKIAFVRISRNANGYLGKEISTFEPIVELLRGQQAAFNMGNANNQNAITNKYKSRNIYKSLNTSIGWLTPNKSITSSNDMSNQSSNYLIFCNSHILLFSNGQSFHLQLLKNLFISIQIDSVRILTQNGHITYRIVPPLYRLLVQNQIQIQHTKQQQKYILLRQQYNNYIDQKIVDMKKIREILYIGKKQGGYNIKNYSNISFLNKKNTKMIKESEKISENRPNSQNIQGGNKSPVLKRLRSQKNEEQLLQSQSQRQANQQYQFDQLEIQQIQQQILSPLITASAFCINPTDQVKIFKFILFLKNFTSSKIDVSELCQQFRIINSLKFQYLNRMLTIQQFRHLRYTQKQLFLTILLRYNMHYVANIIFKSIHDWVHIFLHWAKCKIEKYNETIAYEQIKDKFYQYQYNKVNTTNTNKYTIVFTEIAKYCMDRNKFALAQNFIELQQDHDRKIMVYLMLITAKKDRKMIQKLLQSTQKTTRSFLVYKVIKQLIQANWVQNYIWVNLLHGKTKVQRYYVKYLKVHKKQQLLKQYYIQNKAYEQLGYQQLNKFIISTTTDKINQTPQQHLTDYQRYYKHSDFYKQKLITQQDQYKKFIPSLYSTLKVYKNNQHLSLLRKVKQYSIQDIASDIDGIQGKIVAIKQDIVLEYLGELLLMKVSRINEDDLKNQNERKMKENVEDLAFKCIRMIKNQKVYGILQRKGNSLLAANLAYERGNKAQLEEMKERYPEYQQQLNQKLSLLSNKR